MILDQQKIGFIGFGNMAQAIAKGWLDSGKVSTNQLYASARNQERLKENTERLGITAIKSNQELVETVDIVIVAVKSYQIKELFEPLKEILKDKIIVSLAVNMLCGDFEEILLEGTQHLSTLPNTPVTIREGIVLFEEQHTLTPKVLNLITKLFKLLGHVEEIPTEQMGIAGLISGSAPAFVDLFIEALGDAAVKHGLDRQTAYKLISQMISGTGKLQLETGKHPGELKDAITSPGGTTIKGISALEKNNFRGAIIEAVDSILSGS
ncbi:pyrroline-5-carboxylate reductase [Atopostipes suicloacalis DSM 15692]|uniref:Pyrroline-5-carboxylate reductase n=1 Tax=Atopostipes suicloacalis DSM 15692 TaxID=1121025 RepID=A0A1M4S4H7_9LACT|nr:pyrroline-5-carboxylate reductase [Atopostipes suicloacalis]SHE27105.1 pyrroline-5-carboxylate reductase [Atopostipes suicloacalis DSM 15692]